MPQPTLSEIFPGATQDINSITIPKAALPNLTALTDNFGDQIVVGISGALVAFYTPLRRNGDSTATPAVVGDKDASVIAELDGRQINRDFDTGTDYEERIVTLRLYKISPSTGLTPDDY